MKKAILCIIILFGVNFHNIKAQVNYNLIVNGNFESPHFTSYSYNDTDFNSSATCWGRANKYNVSYDMEIPYWGAAINPATGIFDTPLRFVDPGFPQSKTIEFFENLPKIVVSSKVFTDTSKPSFRRHYAQTKLLAPLSAGKTYYLSFKAFGLKQSKYVDSVKLYNVLSNIGFYFSVNQLKDYSNPGRINVIPQIRFSGWTFDRWDTCSVVELKGSFVALGGEKFLTIGNFDYFKDFALAAMNGYNKGPFVSDTSSLTPSLLYIDDISLVSDTTLPIISLDRFSLGKDTSLACLGDSITLGGEAHFFHYWWNTGDTSRFITIKSPGTYWCTVDYGCSTYTDTIVVKPLDFSFSLGKDTSINCSGSTVRLNAPAGYTYVWSTGASTAFADISSPGTYWCRLDYGCGTITDTILVKANPFTFSLGADTSIKCFADSIRVFAASMYTNFWSTGETGSSILITVPGTYWCRADDGCTTFTDTIIISPILETFSLGKDTSICTNVPLVLSSALAKKYLWNTGDTSRFININRPGTYWCSADFGCNTVTDTIVVMGSVAPAPFNIKDTALCEAQLPISISAPYTAAAYLWSNGSTAFSTKFNSIGKQWLRISNACGDQYFTDTFDIKSHNVSLNNINLGKDTNNCLYGFYLDTIILQVPVNAATQIKWSNGSSNNSIKVWEPGAYWVQVSNVCYTVADTINITGCAARDVPKVDIPNAFTPNGDGKNDVFRLKYLPQQVVSFNLKIYNRYGQMISELRNRSDYWDGGNYELGVYYYLFVYKDISGKEYMQKGDISLVR